jgi:hypothetical protein
MTDLDDDEIQRLSEMHDILSAQSKSDNKEGVVQLDADSSIEEVLTPTPITQKTDKMAYELVDSLEEKLEKVLEVEDEFKKKFVIGTKFIFRSGKIKHSDEYTKYVFTISNINSSGSILITNPYTGTVTLPANSTVGNYDEFIFVDEIFDKMNDGYYLYLKYKEKGVELVHFFVYDHSHNTFGIRNSYKITDKEYEPITIYNATIAKFGIYLSKKDVEILTTKEFNDILGTRTLKSPYNTFYKEPTFLERRTIIENILNDLFPDSWYYSEVYDKNVQSGSINNGNILIYYMIKFPQIDLVNSRGEKHTIYDIHVVFGVTNNFKCTHSRPLGFKTSFIPQELESGYVHSHLSAIGSSSNPLHYGFISTFCLGEGQPISLALAKMCSNSFNENDWLSFFMQIPTYLSWESLEGVPHIKMNSIAKNESQYTQISMDATLITSGLQTSSYISGVDEFYPNEIKNEMFNSNFLNQLSYIVVKQNNIDYLKVDPRSIIEADEKNTKLIPKLYFNNGIYYIKRNTSENFGSTVRTAISNFKNTSVVKFLTTSQNTIFKNVKDSKHNDYKFEMKLIDVKKDEVDYELVPSPLHVKQLEHTINNIIN